MVKIFVLIILSLGSAAEAAEPKLVSVPGGRLTPFWITPKEKTGEVETIEVPAFEAMVSPVTNKEFRSFLKKRSDWKRANVKSVFADGSYLERLAGAKPNAPITFVSWFAAQAYCEEKGMRLPTLIEWEYMAAASEDKADASKDPEFLGRILEWYSEPRSNNGLPPVGQKKPNLYGVRDLHGLVWEWVEDFNSSLVTGEGRTDGSLNRELFCGAGAMSGGNKENYAAFMRFAFRSSLKGASTAWNLGFRCVKGNSK